MGSLGDSSLIAKSIGNARFIFIASPAYLKKRGTPKNAQQLKLHDLLLFGDGSAPLKLVDEKGAPVVVAVQPRLRTLDMDVLRQAALDGNGIVLLPVFVVLREVREKRLEAILRKWGAPIVPAHILYPSSRHVSPKVRAFVEHLQRAMNPPPWEVGPLP